MIKLYTKYNKLTLKKRKEVNFFIRMAGCNSNNIKIIKKKYNFYTGLQGIFKSIRKGNIHQIMYYTDSKLKNRENFNGTTSTFRSVESSYKMFLAYYNKNHNKESIIDYFKCFIEYNYLILKSICRHINNDLNTLKYLIDINNTFPIFLFCPNINKAVIGTNIPRIKYNDIEYSLSTNLKHNIIKNYYNNIKCFIKYYENKDYKNLKKLLLNDTGFNLIWNYQDSNKKLNDLKFLKEKKDNIFINEFNMSFTKILEKSIKSI